MRFLLDANQSPQLAVVLVGEDHDVVHLRELGLSEASDAVVLALAESQRRVVISGDTDFGELLARSNAAGLRCS